MRYWTAVAVLLVVLCGLLLAVEQATRVALVTGVVFVAAAWWVRHGSRHEAEPSPSQDDGAAHDMSPEEAARLLRIVRWSFGGVGALTIALMAVFAVLLLAEDEVGLTVSMALVYVSILALTWWRLRRPYASTRAVASQTADGVDEKIVR